MAGLEMLSKDKLLESFGEISTFSSGLVACKHNMREFSYHHYFRLEGNANVLVVVKDAASISEIDAIFSAVPSSIPCDVVTVFQVKSADAKFANVIVVPPSYHGYLKGAYGIVEADRKELYLAVPFHTGEFSGLETASEFEALRMESVDTLNWRRAVSPRVSLYFENPKTGAGTSQQGELISFSVLLDEIDALNGVSNGFLEITNFAGDVVEVISPSVDSYVLIERRVDETEMSLTNLIDKVYYFLIGQLKVA